MLFIMLSMMFNNYNQMTAFWLTLIFGVTIQIANYRAYMNRMAIVRRARFKKGEVVNCLLNGDVIWAEGVITEVYDVNKFGVSIKESKLSPQILEQFNDRRDHTVGLAQIRKRVHHPTTPNNPQNQRRRRRRFMTPSPKKVTGAVNSVNPEWFYQQKSEVVWHLDEMDHKEQCNVLMVNLIEIYEAIDSETVMIPMENECSEEARARFVALEILGFLYSPKYRWAAHCFWCDEPGVKMHRGLCQHWLMGTGFGHGVFDDLLPITLFCNECNEWMDLADYVFRCDRQEHHICIPCLKNKKRIRDIMESVVSPLDSNCIQCVVEYVEGEFKCSTTKRIPSL